MGMPSTLIDLLKQSGNWNEANPPEPPPRPRFYWFFVFVGLLTALTWLQLMAEFFSDFDFSAMPFEFNNVYLLFLGAYAGTKELSKASDPAPLPEKDARLIKGEFFLVLWGLTAAFMYLTARWYPRYHTPHDLPLLIKGVLGIFVGGYGAKSYRAWLIGGKTPAAKRIRAADPMNGADAPPASDKEALAQRVVDLLWTAPEGLTRREIEEATDIEKWALIRLLNQTGKAGRIVRLSEGRKDSDTRYAIPEFAKSKR